MKLLIYLFLLITLTNCGRPQQVNNSEANAIAIAQNEQPHILVGRIDREDLQKSPHNRWFGPIYQSYTPNENALKVIQDNINKYEIKMFMGTWCADSQYEVPRFYKLLDQSNFNTDNLEVTAVQEDKTLPGGSERDFNIIYVPTIIFFQNGKEVGRFVEYAQEELDFDIAKIVSGQKYMHSYYTD